MMEMGKRGEFSSELESWIESSEVHWSEVVRAVAEAEHSAEANRKHYEVLSRRRYVREGGQLVAKQLESIDEKQPGWSFFYRGGLWDERLVVGEKLAEGGQAEIYAATLGGPVVLKVFKVGSVLQELEKQIPLALLKQFQYDGDHLPQPMRAILLRDGRFAFVMLRHWGDLRRLIDELMMLHSHNQGPPFPPNVVLGLMKDIAKDMTCLHGQDPPILHNDLKAANVLVHGTPEGRPNSYDDGSYDVSVADYECSVGVVGTGIWRAPEILRHLKSKVPIVDLVFTMKCDVYSYGMTCYEIVSGRLPFEEYDFPKARELFLSGERPKLPPNLHPKVENIIKSCWHSNPLERPSFYDIHAQLDHLMKQNAS